MSASSNVKQASQMSDSSLTFSCPHCGHKHEDSLEVLEPDIADSMRCEGCAQSFSVALMECHRCAAEQVHTWRGEPATGVLETLKCHTCGNTLRMDYAGEREF